MNDNATVSVCFFPLLRAKMYQEAALSNRQM